jgi:hypothetical protein
MISLNRWRIAVKCYITVFGHMYATLRAHYNLEGFSVVDSGAKLRVRQYGFRIPAEAKHFSSFRNVQTGAEAHTASYSVGT